MLSTFIKVVKNTHRHPFNQALHCIGAPFYVIGLCIIVGYILGAGTNLFLGITLWASAVAIFVAGHKIENNIMTMTPVLIARLLSRQIASYLFGNRIHLLRA